MKYTLFCAVLFVVLTSACVQKTNNQHNHQTDVHDHDHNHEHDHDHDPNHNHSSVEHQHIHEEDHTIHYLTYSDEFELFIESSPFVIGEQATVSAHVTWLKNFKPLESGKVTLRLTVLRDTLIKSVDGSVQKGIFEFNLTPDEPGAGRLDFIIDKDGRKYIVTIPEVEVFAEHDDAHALIEAGHHTEDGVTFTKEQSWKTNFATGTPRIAPMGQVIRGTAKIDPAAGTGSVLVSRAGGIVRITSDDFFEGRAVAEGEVLFHVTGGGMAGNDVSVRFLEARNNFEKAEADFRRIEKLAAEQIVSQRELLEARQQYDNSRAVYENLTNNINKSGQSVTSPAEGFIRQIFVSNGQYVEAGTPLATIAQSNRLALTVQLPLRYATWLDKIDNAHIKDAVNENTYTLSELNGRIVSVGRATGQDNHLVPLSILIDNNGSFIPGSFVEVFLKTKADEPLLTIPGTSLLEEQGQYFVWVQQTPEFFEKRHIIPGITDGLYTEVKEGLSPEERIVTKGAMMIKLSETAGMPDAHAGHVH